MSYHGLGTSASIGPTAAATLLTETRCVTIPPPSGCYTCPSGMELRTSPEPGVPPWCVGAPVPGLVPLTRAAPPGITYAPNYVGLSIVGAGALVFGGATALLTKSSKKAAWGALLGATAALVVPIPFSSSNPLDRIVLRRGWA